MSYKLKSDGYIVTLTRELLDSQPTNRETVAVNYRIVLPILAVVLTVFLGVFAAYRAGHADPYVQTVLSMEGDASQGRVIFEMNCASCHGLYGDGQVGPSLKHVSDRKSKVGLIKQVISGKTPPMPQFQPTPEEMADLLQYLERL